MAMTASQFCAALDRLGLTPAGAAEFLDVTDRTLRRWKTGAAAVPAPVAKLLRVMIAHDIAKENVQ